MANFVMSLASSPLISHAVALCASPFCHYHYSNLTKVLRHWEVSEFDFRVFIRPFVPVPRLFGEGMRYYALTHDVTKMLKAHSPCLVPIVRLRPGMKVWAKAPDDKLTGERPVSMGKNST